MEEIRMSGRKALILGCAFGAVVATNVFLWTVFFGSDATPERRITGGAVPASSALPAQSPCPEENTPDTTGELLERTPPSVPAPPAAVVSQETEGMSAEELKELSTKGFVIEDHRPKPKPQPRPKIVKVITGDEEPLPEGEFPPADIKVHGK
jgi:hypothetical protein